MRDRITANHLVLIRSFLIDSVCSPGSRAGICAKFFYRAGTFAANSVNEKCNARCANFSSQMCMRRELPPLQKPLFNRIFFNFCNVRTNRCCVLLARAINFKFDLVTSSHRVARTSRTRFVKRQRCFFRRAVVNRMQCVSIRDAC